MNSCVLPVNLLSKTDIISPPLTAPVSGFARSFLSGKPIANANITILENSEQFNTDIHGRFGPFQYPVGKSITLILDKKGYHKTQTATVTVPVEGLNDPLHEISFQVPSHFAFTLFSHAMGVDIDDDACQVVATITAKNKTMNDIPQGEANAKVVLCPDLGIKPFYFGIIKHHPFKHKTNPFYHKLASTSLDGGVGFLNVTPSVEPYTLTAMKPGIFFNQVKFIAEKGTLINLSPPQGPMALQNQDNLQAQHHQVNVKNDKLKSPVKYICSHFGLFPSAPGTLLANRTVIYDINRNHISARKP